MYETITDKNAYSLYQPSQEVCDFTAQVKRDYSIGDDILNRAWTELNDRSVIDDENRGQKMFNAFVDTSVEDPAEAWKWRGTRSKARNKGIVMHANLTGNFLLPLFTAQNDDDEVDQGFSEVMRDLVEWMILPSNSDYQSSFMQLVFGMITNPVTYMGVEFHEIYQTIKSRELDGTLTRKEILDEVLSGFQAPIYSSSQILITNAFERNIQKQRRIIKRRYCEYEELKAKYGDHPNWDFVTPGIRSIYNEEDGLFYSVKDTDNIGNNIIAEETSLSRRDDSEVCFINGIYMGDMKSIDNNPVLHRDNRDTPKYNVVPFGYSRIGEHFFYYKSMMNTLGWDNMYYDAMSEVVMNRALLEVDMPVVFTGSDQIDSDVVFPNSVVTLEDPNARVMPLLPQSNMAAGFNALRETEDSIDDGSTSPTVSGELPQASQKAYSVAQAQANSKKLIGAVGKTLGESVIMVGDLMKDIVLNHFTVPQVDLLVGDSMRLKYRQFFLAGKSKTGGSANKTIKFDADLIGVEMTKKDKQYAEMELLENQGYPDNKDSLRVINPEMFARFKYFSRIDVEEMFSKNSEYWQATILNLKQSLALDPYTDQEGLTKLLMEAYFQSKGDSLVKKAPATPPQPPTDGAPAGPNGGGFGAMAQGRALSTASMNAGAQ